jgi:hypothetical protein
VQQFVRIGIGSVAFPYDITAMYALALRYKIYIFYFIREGIKNAQEILKSSHR